MKKFIAFLSIAALITIVFSACSKDDGPQDSDIFVGTYKGNVAYASASQNEANQNGSVTVTKVNNTYSFIFSNDIPDIKGIQFEEDEDDNYISVGNTTASYIKINKSTLVILYVDTDATWTANCTR